MILEQILGRVLLNGLCIVGGLFHLGMASLSVWGGNKSATLSFCFVVFLATAAVFLFRAFGGLMGYTTPAVALYWNVAIPAFGFVVFLILLRLESKQ